MATKKDSSKTTKDKAFYPFMGKKGGKAATKSGKATKGGKKC